MREQYSCADQVACDAGATSWIELLVDERLRRHNEEVHIDFLGVGVLDLDGCNASRDRFIERVVSDLAKWLRDYTVYDRILQAF